MNLKGTEFPDTEGFSHRMRSAILLIWQQI